MRGLTRDEHRVLRGLAAFGPQVEGLDPQLDDVYDALEERGLLVHRYAFTEETVRILDAEWEEVTTVDVFEQDITSDGRLALRVCTVDGVGSEG